MKNIIKTSAYLLFTLFYAFQINAQSSAGMNYQSVIRNSSNTLVANTTVGIKISILQSTSTGTVVFSERHTPTTNANGLATLIIGAGISLSGNYGNINWGADTYYLKTETDPTGGTNYTITNISQFMSVPYAKFAENTENAWAKTGNEVDTTTDFIGSTNNADVVFKRGNAEVLRFDQVGSLKLSGSEGNRKISLWDFNNNDHQFLGFGLNNSVLRYQTNGAGSDHVFYSGINSSSSNELMRIRGNGNVGIGGIIPSEKLEVVGKTKTTNLQVTDGAGANKVLTSDASGNATWQNLNKNTGFEAVITLPQTIPNNIATKVNYTLELTDDANAYNPFTYEWTVPASGFYHLDVSVFVSTIFSTPLPVTLYVRVNNVDRKLYRNYINGNTLVPLSFNTALNAGDVVTVFFLQSSGSSVNLLQGSTYSTFSAFKVY